MKQKHATAKDTKQAVFGFRHGKLEKLKADFKKQKQNLMVIWKVLFSQEINLLKTVQNKNYI